MTTYAAYLVKNLPLRLMEGSYRFQFDRLGVGSGHRFATFSLNLVGN